MILELPLKIETLNKQLRWHWGRRVKESKAWRKAIASMVKRDQCKVYKNVEIVSYRKRLLDEDNLVGGAKVVVDSIRGIGLIKNDDPKSVKIIYDQYRSKKEKTVITFY